MIWLLFMAESVTSLWRDEISPLLSLSHCNQCPMRALRRT